MVKSKSAASPGARISTVTPTTTTQLSWSPWSSTRKSRHFNQSDNINKNTDPDDPRKALNGQDDDDDAGQDEVYDDAPINQGLISKRRKSFRDHAHYYNYHSSYYYNKQNEWMRPYWLGMSLFLILFAFWLLDSLKDPIFARLVDGQISTHQPLAKLMSVFTTLILVCLLEYWTNRRQQKQQEELIDQYSNIRPSEDILDPGGIWRRMSMADSNKNRGNTTTTAGRSFIAEKATKQENALDDTVSVVIFFQIGVPYVVAFLVIAYLIWTFEQQDSIESIQGQEQIPKKFDAWYVLGYVMYATIESFGSLAVATFWSYTNSTLALQDAERYYGPIIATAQLGAIGGSTLVASGRWDAPELLVVVALFIVLQLILMQLYDRRFEPTSVLAVEAAAAVASVAGTSGVDDTQSVLTWQDNNATITKPFWSGLYLIFRHGYVLLILGVSCLYEICMTLLDYQMKLLGFAKFDQQEGVDGDVTNMSFSEFMGRYGQAVNFTSLIFSSMLFPWLIRRLGLRRTLLLFPSMLLLVTFLAYGVLPGNLSVLFFSLSLLKAMTYSVHDPSKELLYIPTSNAIKFRAKFWIDVVGERISKAIGSAFNTLADNVEQSVKIGTIPSLLSALGLWLVCYYVGIYFDRLLATGKIVGLEYSIDPSTYSRVANHERDDDDDGNQNHDSHISEPSEVEIMFEEDNVSTLDLMADPVQDAHRRNELHETSAQIELPHLIRI